MTRNNEQDTDPRHEHTQPSAPTSLPIACDLTALSAEQRSAHLALVAQLFGSLVREIRELPDGYAYRFDGEHYQLAAEFIANERLCCPFLTFGLDVSPQRGPVWLRMTGEGEVTLCTD